MVMLLCCYRNSIMLYNKGCFLDIAVSLCFNLQQYEVRRIQEMSQLTQISLASQFRSGISMCTFFINMRTISFILWALYLHVHMKTAIIFFLYGFYWKSKLNFQNTELPTNRHIRH